MPSFEEKIAAGRVPCCVPGCGRTYKPEGYAEVICGKHWKMSSRHLRRRHSKLLKIYRMRFGDTPYWEFPAGSPKRLKAVQVNNLCHAAWLRCKTQAIERAMGI